MDMEAFTSLAVEASMCAGLVRGMDKNGAPTGHSGSKGMTSAKYEDLDKESMDMTTMFNSQWWDCWRKVISVCLVFSWGETLWKCLKIAIPEPFPNYIIKFNIKFRASLF